MTNSRDSVRVGRRGLVWKQLVLTADQEALVRREMARRGRSFQNLADEALEAYFTRIGETWPPRPYERKVS